MVIIVVALIAASLAALSYYEKKKLDASNDAAQNYQDELAANTQTVYVASADIKKGDTILTDAMAKKINSKTDASTSRDEETAGAVLNNVKTANVESQNIYTSLPAESYITKDQLGTIATVDIAKGQPIMANIVRDLDITEDTREFEIGAANLMVDQENNDVIDIRISYPNGEDYTVLSKKTVNNLSLAQANFWTYLSEDEILRYQSAVVDAYQTTGTRIYATRYVEDNLQKAATPNYLVRSETIDLIRKDPNIYKKAEETMDAAARLSLEQRLGQLTEDQLSAVSDGYGLVDTARSSVLSQNVDNNSDTIDSYGIEDESASDETESTDETASTEDSLSSPAVQETETTSTTTK